MDGNNVQRREGEMDGNTCTCNVQRRDVDLFD
jgi:hypothetical protein